MSAPPLSETGRVATRLDTFLARRQEEHSAEEYHSLEPDAPYERVWTFSDDELRAFLLEFMTGAE